MSLLSKIILLLGVVSMPLSALGAPIKEVGAKKRAAMANQMLKQHSDSLLVYTKGLVCKSCGIGIRKHIGKLKGVDLSRGNKGVVLDVHHQMVQVMGRPDASSVAQAIRDAGYTPVKAYSKVRGKLVVKSF